ncbi:MAG TPA: autoinducer 2 import system permease LsrD [Proteiniclasticum sp.]|jgi:AI-2 transport system permease protein|uniref:ABC transporter permease subunit n=1 Tax=Proteiniclasticum sp. TaxID=2053595 RepID=UPI000E7E9766|nr:autoinducer 2 import system permease LsrD [Proteiniclasticum sp.]HBW14049.1 autoinducer 2 import system permease LsrD [Proteiniclasticum sp.]
MKKYRKFMRWETMLIVLLLAEILIFGAINPKFLNLRTLLYSINDFVAIGIVSLFVTFVIITGGMDISSGSIIGLTSISMGLLWKLLGINIWLTVPFALMVGLLAGSLNGYLVSYVGVQPMVTTLGTSLFFSGLSLVIMGLSGASTYEGIGNFPRSFINLSNGSILYLPIPLLILIALFIVSYVLLHKTKYGRYIFLIGINPNAAKYSGIKLKPVIMSVYMLSGVAASIAGVIMTSYLGSSRPDHGATLTMPIITAVVLGGTLITGGGGSVFGTALAALIVGFFRFGSQMAGISSQHISIGEGILLITAVALRGVDLRNAMNHLLPQRNIIKN